MKPLNDLKAKLRGEGGLVVDDRDYTHQFRLHRSKQPDDAAAAKFDSFLGEVHPGLGLEGVTKTENLGCIDFFPSTSGKSSLGWWFVDSLLEKEAGFKSRPLVFTCGDDDNDIDLARSAFVAYACFPKKSGRLVKLMEELETVGKEGDAADDGGLKRFSFLGKVEDATDGLQETREPWEVLRDDTESTEIMLERIISAARSS